MTMQPSPYDAPVPPPPPPPPPGQRRATGKDLLNASWRMLRQDRELLWLPMLGAVTGLVAAAVLFLPGWLVGAALDGTGQHTFAGWLGGLFAAAAATIVSIFFQASLVIGANARADGGNPTLGHCLREAWSRRGPIISWGLLTTTVGVAIRTLERRLGILGSILGFLGGLAWAIASFLVVPVLVAEDIGPVAAVKRSAQLLKATWGTSLRTTLRFGVVQLLFFVPVTVAVVGVFSIGSGSTAGIVVGVLFVLAGVVGFLGLAMVFSAIGSYARALIYRYATGRPVPGVDPILFTGVFQPKKSLRSRFS